MMCCFHSHFLSLKIQIWKHVTLMAITKTNFQDPAHHYGGVIMGAIASQITSLTIVYSDADQRKHQSSTSLTFVWGIHRGPVNSPHKWPVTRKMFPFDDVIMLRLFINVIRIDWHKINVNKMSTLLKLHPNNAGDIVLTFSLRNQCIQTFHLMRRFSHTLLQ